MDAKSYLALFHEHCKGQTIKLILVGGRVLNGTLSSSDKWDKEHNPAYVIVNPKTLVLFNVNDVMHIYDKKRIRKKRYA